MSDPRSVPLQAVVRDRANSLALNAKAAYSVQNHRRILCVFPRYTHSFGTFDHAFPLMGVRAFMPPQGMLVVAAYLPGTWEVRFIDENVLEVTDGDLFWADAVFLSGMHVQHPRLSDLNRRAHQFGKLTVLGGPSVSACPDWYPDFDILHLGEIGDATDAIVRRIDQCVGRPRQQEVYETEERLPLASFPTPAYQQIRLTDYFLASVQFSSGCPYLCEFCDIPALYGRNPRLKTPDQVTAELDAMLERGNPGAVYFVDDNFIANRRAAVALLDALIDWQQRRGYPLEFACEATLNIAQAPEVLEKMREANFCTVFCGIETPEQGALKSIHKEQNLRLPILDAVRTLNSHGIEVVSGIILGLDTDTLETGRKIVEFIEASAIPMLTINMLHALPKTPLWDRLEREGRLVDGFGRESNVEFLLPYETVREMWRDCVTQAYAPDALFRRFEHQLAHTYPNRRPLPNSPARLNGANIRRGMSILARLLWQVGARAEYRSRFWQMAGPLLRKAKVEEVIHIGIVAHHLIRFAQECERGEAEVCFYSPRRSTSSLAA